MGLTTKFVEHIKEIRMDIQDYAGIIEGFENAYVSHMNRCLKEKDACSLCQMYDETINRQKHILAELYKKLMAVRGGFIT